MITPTIRRISTGTYVRHDDDKIYVRGGGRTITASGDSGGPLLWTHPSGQQYLVGILQTAQREGEKKKRGKKMKNKFTILAILAVFALSISISAQTTTFTYQGHLNDSAMAANGTYDLQLALFDAQAGGAQIGTTQTRPAVSVSNGIFAVELDFGANAFPGLKRYLEIAVKRPADAGFTTLTPRQQTTSSPYSIRSLSAAAADNAAQLGGTNASEFVQTTDSRLSDSRTPTAGSNNYIQNTTTQQAGANFNIGGTGTASIINAATQYNINGTRVLAVGNNAVFLGGGAGTFNTSGNQNTFIGSFAGRNNITGSKNTFVGSSAGFSVVGAENNSFFGRNAGFSTTSSNNSFFGSDAGTVNTSGGDNSFFGYSSGVANTMGSSNSFFGFRSGFGNTIGGDNTFIGKNAGLANTDGSNNSFVGSGAGILTGTGDRNTFFGAGSGSSNTSGNNNTMIGFDANVGSGNLSYATAVGSGAVVSTSNTVAIGRLGDKIILSGRVQLSSLAVNGVTVLCRNASGEISTCPTALPRIGKINEEQQAQIE
ncbi:MAG: hypothetical protein ABIV21_06235, partial [Pyrinomonadaceae bacterium]